MKDKKEKKQIAPNECSLKRWIAVLVTGLVIGLTLDIPLNPYMENRVDSIMGISYADFFGVLSFIPLFLGMTLALWLVGKTSLKNFVLGVGGTVNKKVCLTVLGIFAAGFAIPYLLTASNLRLRGVEAGQFAFLILFMLLTTWIQTTWEELIFRGLFIRWACKNNVGYTKKALITGASGQLAGVCPVPRSQSRGDLPERLWNPACRRCIHHSRLRVLPCRPAFWKPPARYHRALAQQLHFVHLGLLGGECSCSPHPPDRHHPQPRRMDAGLHSSGLSASPGIHPLGWQKENRSSFISKFIRQNP